MVEILLSNSQKADVLLLGIEYDGTSSFGKGADRGPRAIIDCFDTQLELYDHVAKWSPARHLRISSVIIPGLRDKKPEAMAEEVSNEMKIRLRRHKFVICLGGEHSISTGIFKAMEKVSGKTTILQIDAHLDLRDDDSDYNPNPSRFAHSCVMRRALDLGFRLVSVGARAYADFELKTARKNNVKMFGWPCDESKKLVSRIVNSIKTNDVYISLDADGLDPAHMPATGTPVQGGLSWKFTIELLKEIFRRKNVIGADIVEVAPRQNDHLTEFGAAQLCYHMIALKFKNKVNKKDKNKK